jgi:hypothetical protein
METGEFRMGFKGREMGLIREIAADPDKTI